jgi:hypothetical protein
MRGGGGEFGGGAGDRARRQRGRCRRAKRRISAGDGGGAHYRG